MDMEPFRNLKGRDMIELGKERFLAITPPYTGDILWEHVDILQKGKWYNWEKFPDWTSLSDQYVQGFLFVVLN